MYHQVKVAKLSETQKSKLRNMHPVRIKLASDGDVIHVTKEQLKHLERAHKKGRAYTITFHPEQAEKHAAGLFGTIASKIKHLAHKHKDVVNPILKGLKTGAHKAVSKLAKHSHHTIEKLHELEGDGMHHSHHHKRRGRKPKSGEGIIGDLAKGLINISGLGVEHKPKRAKRKKGDGLKDLAKSGLKAIGPKIVDAVSNAVKDKIAGTGVKRHRKRKTIRGSALMPAGY